ncbi:MAG: hypothetical protein AAB638_02520 [Patescibacteria group bacterium]
MKRSMFVVIASVLAIVAGFVFGILIGEGEVKVRMSQPAAKVVKLSNGARLKYLEIGGHQFVMAEIIPISPGVSPSCDIFIMKQDGTRDYSARVNCP